jgi:hypothetical protein
MKMARMKVITGGGNGENVGGAGGFYERAKAHVRFAGGEWFVADKRTNLQQWRAWIAYFAWLDGQTSPPGKNASTFRLLEKLTVPTAWPLEFDVDAPPTPLPEPREEPLTPERRRALAAALRQAVAHLGMPEERRRTDFQSPRSPGEAEAARRHFEARLSELAAEYAATPPRVSRELVKPSPPPLDEAIDFEAVTPLDHCNKMLSPALTVLLT